MITEHQPRCMFLRFRCFKIDFSFGRLFIFVTAKASELPSMSEVKSFQFQHLATVNVIYG